MSEEAREIAGRLTEAQINALCFPQGYHSSATRQALRNRNLITLAGEPTSLGYTVRKALMERGE